MLLQKTETSKASKIVLIVGMILILAVAVMYLFWDDAPPSPSPQASAPAPIAASVAPPAPAFTETSASAPVAAQGDYLNSPADLRQLTELQAALELKKLDVAIAEQEARLQELGAGPGSPAVPQIVALPGAALPTDVGAAPQGLPSTGERVISVQGLGGQIMATVETPEGLHTIRVGDTLGYGQVERISIAGVEIRDGDQTRLIAVEE